MRNNYSIYLTEKRIEYGLTMKKLSEKTGVSIRKIENIEKENAKGYSMHDLTRYLKGLNIPLSKIMPEDGVLIECKRGEEQ
jgi:transcriptional regulator with XRE-family HTH domain